MIALDEGGRGWTRSSRHEVPSALAGLVKAVWTLPPQRGPGAERWRVVADPNPHVLVHRLRDGRTRATAVGPRSRFVDVNQAERSFTVGVRLEVGALRALGGPPAWELRDRGAPLVDLFGAAGRATERRLEDGRTPDDAASALVELLLRRARGVEVNWRVRGLMSHLGRDPRLTIGRVSGCMGVSERGLREVAREEVGLSPKAVQRTVRLLGALRMLRTGANRTHARAALAAGYVDQSHFVHECRALLGETPRRFLARGRAADSYNTGDRSRS